MSTRSSAGSPPATGFRGDGYAVVEELLTRRELSAMRRDVDAVLAAPLPSGCERPHNTLAPLRWNDRPVRRVLSSERRDCLLLSFAPSWRHLPHDVRAHLIRHPALPTLAERPAPGSWPADLLPGFDGRPRDLRLERVAPSDFEMRD